MGLTLSAAKETKWDAIIIGAGMGGAAAAYALTACGWRVLVVERGVEAPSSEPFDEGEEDPDRRIASARWPTKIAGAVDGKDFAFFAPLGSGLGGSTLLYAAALDRFRRVDFEARPHPEGGTLGWPMAYDDFRPWYARAEAALGVTGTSDPLDREAETDALGTPKELSARDADFARRFEAAGLHPYRLHSGFAHKPGCTLCLAEVCPKDCKRHAGNSFLTPALATERAAVLSEAEVLGLVAGPKRVEAIRVRMNGETHHLQAQHFLLAAGSYASPALLLRSVSAAWPEGLGNRHDQVGRNLMFHTSRFLALWNTRALAREKQGKSLVLRDFYDAPEGKFGEVQSVGLEANYGYVLYALRQMIAQSRYAGLPLINQLARVPAKAASLLLGDAAIFDLMMEDLPYPDNRVTLDHTAPSGLRFDYHIRDELRARYALYGRAVKARLRGTRSLFLTQGLTLNHGHPMGTCRIGTDPATSVADPTGRVHGVENLHIADGSFLPTAGGTNPSLTIAAHALRLGHGLAGREKVADPGR